MEQRNNQRDDFLKHMLASKLFDGLSLSEMHALCSISESKFYTAGTVLVKEGETGDTFFWIESGRLEVQIKPIKDKEPVTLSQLKAGDMIGEMILLGKTRRTATITVRNEATLFSWRYTDCFKLFDEDPVLGYRLMGNLAKILADRLQDMNLQVRNFADVLDPKMLKYM